MENIEILEGATKETFIYLAGPMSGYPNYNYDTFHAVEDHLRWCGYKWIKNPARHFDGDQSLSWEVYIAKAINALLDSEALVALPGWRESVGARLEVAIATAIGHVVYSAIEDDKEGYRYVLRHVSDAKSLTAAIIGMGEHPLIPSDGIETQKTQRPHEEAATLVLGDRQADYGHPLDNYSRLSLVWTGMLAGKLAPSAFITAEDCVMLLTAMKLVRQMNRPKRDNIVDAHGYLMVNEMIGEERERRSV